MLWYGEHTGGRKFTLSQIAEEIRIRTAAPGGVPGVDWASRDQRLAARASSAGWRRWRGAPPGRQRRGVDRRERQARRAVRLGRGRVEAERGHPPAELERLAEGRATAPHPAQAEGTDEIRLYRTLLLNPAFFRRDDPAAFRLFDDAEKRAHVARQVRNLTHWELEVTAAYAAARPAAPTTRCRRDPAPFRDLARGAVLLRAAARAAGGGAAGAGG